MIYEAPSDQEAKGGKKEIIEQKIAISIPIIWTYFRFNPLHTYISK